MKHELHMSDPGRKALEGREGKRNHAYPDPATGGNPWTIGYGQTGPDIHPGLYWTDEQCDAALSRSLSEVFDPSLNNLVTVALEQHEFDALDSFQYNIGTNAFARSTLLKKLNAGDKTGAAAEFMHWVIPAMITGRRHTELEQFLGHPVVEHPELYAAGPRATEDAVHKALLSALRITDVAGWQRSHSLSPDSVIGPRTLHALVLAFQNAHGLVVDGVVGPRTLDALGL
jgi:lysozyme